ncbi:SART-1 family-domain-containing protein [Amanita rubescens]|nr:SART-1 family-domain-containing protein [Amanita rubescens]
MSDSKYSGSVHRAEFLTEADEKPNGDEMDVDEKPIVPVEREHDFNVNFVDDDELKSALTHLRRAKLHKTKKFTPEQLAQKTEDAQEEEYESGLTFDDTAELVRSVGLISIVREKIQSRLAEQRRRVARRDLEKMQSRGGNKDQAQREYENRPRDQHEARENLDAFKNYRPDINIVYYDEFGRDMTLTPKEAWKALSHKFHGKGSGKMKTEKRLEMIAEGRSNSQWLVVIPR